MILSIHCIKRGIVREKNKLHKEILYISHIPTNFFLLFFRRTSYKKKNRSVLCMVLILYHRIDNGA